MYLYNVLLNSRIINNWSIAFAYILNYIKYTVIVLHLLLGLFLLLY